MEIKITTTIQIGETEYGKEITVSKLEDLSGAFHVLATAIQSKTIPEILADAKFGKTAYWRSFTF